MKKILVIISLFVCQILYAQNPLKDTIQKTEIHFQIEKYLHQAQAAFALGKVDSIFFYYHKVMDLSSKNNLVYYKSEAYLGYGKLYAALGNLDSAMVNMKKSATLKSEIEDYLGLNKTLTNMGDIYIRTGKNIEGLQNGKDAIEAGKKAKYDRGIGIAYLNAGSFLKNLARHEEALDYFQNASKYFEKVKFDAGIGMCYNNIAAVYYTIERFDNAIEYYRKSISIQEKTGNKKEYANAAMNLGMIYSDYNRKGVRRQHQNYDSMFYYFNKAYDIYEEIKEVSGEVKALTNISVGFFMTNNFSRAESTLQRAYDKAKAHKLRHEISNIEKTFGLLYFKMKEYKKSREFYAKAFPYIIEANLKEEEMMWYRDVAAVYDSLGEYKPALRYYEKFVDLMDTLRANEIQKSISTLSMRFDSELKDQQIAAAEERQKLMQEKNDEMQKRLYFIVIGLIFIAAMLVLVFYSFMQKRKANALLQTQNDEIMQQKEEIEVQRNQVMTQKNIIEEQQKNILDSIHYASRIQEAILPQADTINDLFYDNMFVLFKPRDIVSGDFYWIGKKCNKKIVVAADCTGHGVPGAFMSMLGTAFLNEIVGNATESLHAADILNQLREYVIISLRQTGKSGEQKDGMDLALYIYDEETKILEYAGANNPLLIVRNSQTVSSIVENDRIKLYEFVSQENSETYQIIQLVADKMPIGIYSDQKPFSSIEIQLYSTDSVYTFSDGYQDQFGGDKNKKFMVKRLKQMFVDMNAKPMKMQQQILDDTIHNWISVAKTEQVDDVLVIGLQI